MTEKKAAKKAAPKRGPVKKQAAKKPARTETLYVTVPRPVAEDNGIEPSERTLSWSAMTAREHVTEAQRLYDEVEAERGTNVSVEDLHLRVAQARLHVEVARLKQDEVTTRLLSVLVRSNSSVTEQEGGAR